MSHLVIAQSDYANRKHAPSSTTPRRDARAMPGRFEFVYADGVRERFWVSTTLLLGNFSVLDYHPRGERSRHANSSIPYPG